VPSVRAKRNSARAGILTEDEYPFEIEPAGLIPNADELPGAKTTRVGEA
jgi:hypothetical protein